MTTRNFEEHLDSEWFKVFIEITIYKLTEIFVSQNAYLKMYQIQVSFLPQI